MKNFSWIIGAVVVCVLQSCSTVESLSFERLHAADVNFPDMVRRVGVVNNVPYFDMDGLAPKKALPQMEGDGRIASEALAQGIAATNYFDEVVICDSALQGRNITPTDLSKVRVDSLVETLGVDVLFSLDRVHIKLKEGVENGYMTPQFVIDGVITPVVSAYTSGRNAPLFTVSKSDSIYWYIDDELTFGQIQKEASEFAASIPMEHLLPHWKRLVRNYYDGGNVDMRDAGVFVRENNWESAGELWKKVYDSKKGKQRMRAAFNLALYCEMNDDYNQALAYLETAAGLASKGSFDEQMIGLYQVQLTEQMKKVGQLKMQMKRFE